MISSPIGQIVALLFTHYIGDFVFQSHWMGVNKSKRNDVLLLHVQIYTITLAVGCVLTFHTMPRMLAMFVLLNGACHFATDYVTSRMTSKLYAAGKYHEFFLVIGFDQLIHQVTLITTMWLILQ